MQKKKIIVIILTVLIFLSASILGVSAVYRVADVTVNAPVVSLEAQAEAVELQQRLQKAYENDSTIFANDEKAKTIVSEFPYFRLKSFKKDFPDRIVVELQEDEEVYAVPVDGADNSYYILNGEGTVLGVRNNISNRSDGAENIFITGDSRFSVTGEKGKPLSGDDCLQTLFAFCMRVDIRLEGIRRNVVKIEVQRPTVDSTETTFVLFMREGVKIYVRNPSMSTLEKAEKAMDEYFAFDDAKRLNGFLAVYDGENGVLCQYYYDESVLG